MKAKHIQEIKKGNREVFYNSKEWKKKRKEIIERDKRECQRCKEMGRVTLIQSEALEVHHIKLLEEYPELGLDSKNLITLCKQCHNFYHGRFISERENKIAEEIPERW